MKRELELKHLAQYLPYGLKVLRTFNNEIMLMNGISGKNTIEAVELGNNDMCALLAFGDCQIDKDEYFKPVLRNLSDLTKEIKVDGEKFVPIQYLRNEFIKIDGSHRHFDYPLTLDGKYCGVLSLPFWVIEKLISWHFDIFGLIDAGLAIDMKLIN